MHKLQKAHQSCIEKFLLKRNEKNNNREENDPSEEDVPGNMDGTLEILDGVNSQIRLLFLCI